MIERTVDELLQKIEFTLATSKKAFMSDAKMVDESVIMETIARIRENLPCELSDARVIKKESENIKASAQANAAKIIADAQAEAQRLVAESTIVLEAQKEAERILQNASEYANNMVGQAYADLAHLMDEAELHSREILQTIMDKKAKMFPQYDPSTDPNQQ